MPLNVKLLRKVKKHILAEPARLVMADGLLLGTPGETRHYAPAYEEPGECIMPKCGTVGCIAGWACVLGQKDFEKSEYATNWFTIRTTAERLLGIVYGNELFRVESWPNKLCAKYYRAKTNDQRAKLVAERIDQFIAKHR